MPARHVAATIALVSLLAACAARPPARPEVATLPPLDASLSRIFVSAGMSSGVKLWSVKQVGPVYFNGRQVGVTAKDEHFVVDVKPGTYEVSCQPLEPEKNFVEKRSMTFFAGQTTYLACDMAPQGAGAMFGLIGALASQYLTKSYLEERKLEPKSSKLVGYARVP